MKFSFSLKGKHVEKEVEKESHIYIYTHIQGCVFAVFTKEYHVPIAKIR